MRQRGKLCFFPSLALWAGKIFRLQFKRIKVRRGLFEHSHQGQKLAAVGQNPPALVVAFLHVLGRRDGATPRFAVLLGGLGDAVIAFFQRQFSIGML